MVALSIASSSSQRSSPSQPDILAFQSPSLSIASLSANSSASSSRISLKAADEENLTITASRLSKGKEKSSDNLHLLAVSTRITELTYTISDIQTRIFEIQELRHKSQSGDTSAASRVIDQSLAQLDERLNSVAQGVKSVNETIEPLLQSKTPTLSQNGDANEDAATLRKHATMIAEWDAVQKESQVLREELKEDKWLTVFRTVTDQADGMMTSLEKALNRCQDFIYQVYRRGPDELISQSSSMSSLRSEKSPISFDVFNPLLDSYEAKKKHYMPATTKVLSIIDKGVQDRVTKNGECLRRHAECTQRWRNLKERISRTDRDMDNVRRMLLAADMAPSETESNASGTTSQSRSGFLETPPSGSKSAKSKTQNTLSRSMSPFRKLARKMKKGGKSPVPATPTLPKVETRLPASEPARTLKHRSSLFNLLNQQTVPMTPDRPTHKHSQSLTPDSSPARRTESLMSTMKGNRPAWNSSTRVADDEARAATLKGGSQRRASNAGIRTSEDHSSVSSTPYKRSVSRSSMGSSRPWSPVTSSVSTAQSSTNQPLAALYRPPSRSQTPSLAISPRARPTTPSHIPRPSLGGHWPSISSSQSQMSDWDEEGLTSMMQRAFSPTRCQTPSQHPPRPPSRSMIPVPSVQIQGASRPSSAMSNYARPDSAMSFRGGDALRSTPRPSVIQTRGVPPSAFKDSSAPRTPHSRPPSRTGAATPSVDGKGYPVHVYVASNPKDPLDNEVASIANAISHSLLIERVDPPLRAPPREGEEIRAQYAFSNTLARKVVTCKLTTMARREHITKKVMCRVGGGWQDLQVYISNRQAGM